MGTDDAATLTEDRLLDGRVRLAQPASGYRAAIDPVLLAAACPAGPGELVVDLGSGAGAAALCLAARLPDCRIVGLELQPELVELARRNVAANGWAGRIEMRVGDVAAPPADLLGAADQVIANPPYLPAGRATASPRPARAAANQEGAAGLAGWIGAARRILKPKGRLTLIHRADRVDHVVAGLVGAFGAIELLPIWPRAGVPARRVVIRARLGAQAPAAILPGLVLHEADGRFTAAAEAVLRDAAPL